MDKTEELTELRARERELEVAVRSPFLAIDERFAIRRELAEIGAAKKRKSDRIASSATVTLADIAYALKKFKGSIVESARFCGMPSTALRRKIKSTPSLARLLDEIKQDRIDLIEQQLFEQAEGGVMSAISLVLTRLAGDRGYSDKVIVEGEINNNINAASLIAAMRNAAEAKKLEDKTVEVEDYTCLPES